VYFNFYPTKVNLQSVGALGVGAAPLLCSLTMRGIFHTKGLIKSYAISFTSISMRLSLLLLHPYSWFTGVSDVRVIAIYLNKTVFSCCKFFSQIYQVRLLVRRQRTV
jgi:hypothetical protein